MSWSTRILTVAAVFLLVFSIFKGYMTVSGSSIEEQNNKTAVAFLRELYEYESIRDVYEREKTLSSLCTEEVWSQLSTGNDTHWDGTYERTKNYPCTVRVVNTRPGLIIYALESPYVSPSDLWAFSYTIQSGKFVEVNEYKLVGMRQDGRGGFFRND